MTNVKVPVRADGAVSTCSPFPPPIEALAHRLSGVGGRGWGEESAFGQEPTLPLPRMLASEIKQTLLSTSLASLLAFECQAAGPHFRSQNYKD